MCSLLAIASLQEDIVESQAIAESVRPPLQLSATGIAVTRGGTEILKDITLSACTGELVGVLGPSGSGKSTLLYALSGFRPATAGQVRLGGAQLPQDFESVKHDIGFVPQDDIVPTQLKVERVLSYAADLRLPDFELSDRRARINGVMRTLGLSERKNLRVSKLSGGQRKRVSVGVELLAKPRVLFADEPTSGLDPALERALMETFRALADADHLVVVTTHIMSSLELFDRLVVLSGGRLAYNGPGDRLKQYFGVQDYTMIYERLLQQAPADWAARWRKESASYA